MYVTITDVWFLYEHGQTLLYLFTHCTQMQEASNKAAVRYDKAASQHSAAKEMITMAEKQLGDHFHCVDHPSSSPIDLAWQEMLNQVYATPNVLESLHDSDHEGVVRIFVALFCEL